MKKDLLLQVHHVEIASNIEDEYIEPSCFKKGIHKSPLCVLKNHNCVDIIERGNTLLYLCDSAERIRAKSKKIGRNKNKARVNQFIMNKLKSRHVVQIFGRTIESKSIMLEVHGIKPYFFIHCRNPLCLQKELQDLIVRSGRLSQKERRRIYELIHLPLIQSLSNRIRCNIYAHLSPKEVCRAHAIYRKSFFRYHEKESIFVRITFRNGFVANNAAQILTQTKQIGGVSWDVYGLYHHLFRPAAATRNELRDTMKMAIPQSCWVSQFLHDAHCRGMDWIAIDKYNLIAQKTCSTNIQASIFLQAISVRPNRDGEMHITDSQMNESIARCMDISGNLSGKAKQRILEKSNCGSLVDASTQLSPGTLSPFSDSHAVRSSGDCIGATLHLPGLCAPSHSSLQSSSDALKFDRKQPNLKTRNVPIVYQAEKEKHHSEFTTKFDEADNMRIPDRDSTCYPGPENVDYLPLCQMRLAFIECIAHSHDGILAMHLRIEDKQSGVRSRQGSKVLFECIYAVSKIPDHIHADHSSVKVLSTEARLLRDFCIQIFRLDPDVIISWDHDRAGLNLIKKRFHLLTGNILNVGRFRRDHDKNRKKYDGSLLGLRKRRSAISVLPIVDISSNPTTESFISAFGNQVDSIEYQKESEKDTTSTKDVAADLVVIDAMKEVCIDNGRILLNLWQIYRKDHGPDKLSKKTHSDRQTLHSLTAASWYMFGQRMPDIPAETFLKYLSNKSDKSLSQKTESAYSQKSLQTATFLIRAYFIQRNNTLRSIFERKWSLLENISYQCLLYGTLFCDTLSRGSQFRVESVLSGDIDMQGLLYPSIQGVLDDDKPADRKVFHSEHSEPSAIPLVLEPRKGFYTDPVIVLDFRSLYPSIMIAYNLCYSTSVLSLNKELKQSSFTSQESPFTAPNSERFVSPAIHRGAFPQMLHRILRYRIKANAMKKQLSEKKNCELFEKLDRLQRGLKNLSNVCYGYTSAYYSGRLPCAQLADAIVILGRKILEQTMHFVATQCDIWRKEYEVDDVEVVYGDTDSLFVHVRGGTRKKAHAIAGTIVSWVSQEFPSPIALKIEKIFQPCFLLESKRYTGNAFYTIASDKKTSQEDFNYKWEAKGIECVRRDYNLITEVLLRDAIQKWFQWQDSVRMQQYMTDKFQKLLNNEHSPAEFLLYPELKAKKFGLILRSDEHLPIFHYQKRADRLNSNEIREDSIPNQACDGDKRTETNRVSYRIGGPKPNEHFRHGFRVYGKRKRSEPSRSHLPVVVSAHQNYLCHRIPADRERIPYFIQMIQDIDLNIRRSRKSQNNPLVSISKPLYEKVIHPMALHHTNSGESYIDNAISKRGERFALDIVHYIKHKIAPPLQRILKHAGVDIYACIKATEYQKLNSSIVEQWKTFHEQTALKTLPKKSFCKTCRKPLEIDCDASPSNIGKNSCRKCRLLSRETSMKHSINILKSSTDRLFHLQKGCKRCLDIENTELPPEILESCINFECPIFYERASLQEECTSHVDILRKMQGEW